MSPPVASVLAPCDCECHDDPHDPATEQCPDCWLGYGRPTEPGPWTWFECPDCGEVHAYRWPAGWPTTAALWVLCPDKAHLWAKGAAAIRLDPPEAAA